MLNLLSWFPSPLLHLERSQSLCPKSWELCCSQLSALTCWQQQHLGYPNPNFLSKDPSPFLESSFTGLPKVAEGMWGRAKVKGRSPRWSSCLGHALCLYRSAVILNISHLTSTGTRIVGGIVGLCSSFHVVSDVNTAVIIISWPYLVLVKLCLVHRQPKIDGRAATAWSCGCLLS